VAGRVRDQSGRALLSGLCVALAGASASAAPAPALPEDVAYLTDWIEKGSGEHRDRPYAVVDKRDARIYVFEAQGQLVGVSAVLVGQTPGDAGTPLGKRHPYALPLEERTTPAGRFVSQPGHNDKGEPVVWIDHAAALAIHRLRPAPAAQRREARLGSPTPDDNRISLGCVIVPGAFYDRVIGPTLGRGRAVVYVLPEASPVRAMFGPRTDQASALAGL
jgi:hypothetical protein